jgi:hypothetical protein
MGGGVSGKMKRKCARRIMNRKHDKRASFSFTYVGELIQQESWTTLRIRIAHLMLFLMLPPVFKEIKMRSTSFQLLHLLACVTYLRCAHAQGNGRFYCLFVQNPLLHTSHLNFYIEQSWVGVVDGTLPQLPACRRFSNYSPETLVISPAFFFLHILQADWPPNEFLTRIPHNRKLAINTWTRTKLIISGTPSSMMIHGIRTQDFQYLPISVMCSGTCWNQVIFEAHNSKFLLNSSLCMSLHRPACFANVEEHLCQSFYKECAKVNDGSYLPSLPWYVDLCL